MENASQSRMASDSTGFGELPSLDHRDNIHEFGAGSGRLLGWLLRCIILGLALYMISPDSNARAFVAATVARSSS